MTSPAVMATGTGRCGTVALSHVLSGCGICATHERYWTPNPDPDLVPLVDVSALAAPHASRHRAVFHLVRHPLDVISSFHTAGFFGDPSSPWRTSPEGAETARWFTFDDSDPVATGVRYWVEWNKLIEQARCEYRRARIEDLAAVDVQWVAEHAGVDPPSDFTAETVIRSVPSDTNTKRWDVVPVDRADAEHTPMWEELVEMAHRYGYEL